MKGGAGKNPHHSLKAKNHLKLTKESAGMMRKTFMVLSLCAAFLFSADAATVSGVVSDTSGKAIDSAIVSLVPIGGGGTTYRDTTNTTGDYSLAAVAAGTYRISAAKAGYNTMTPSFLTVPNGNNVVTQNLELTPVGAGVTISGTVTAVTGGAGITGAKVRLIQAGVAIDSATTTGATGAYSLPGIQPGTYTINVTATGYTAQTSAAFIVAAAPVTRNFQMASIPAGVTISGTVTAVTGGAGIVGAKVRLRQAGVVIDSATTIAGGAYSIDSVRAGTYTLNVTAAGYIAQTTANITVAAANVTRNFQLVTQPAGVMVSGNVSDVADQSPVAGAMLHLLQGAVVVDSAITTNAGDYSFDSVQAGTYTINVTATGYTAQTTVAFTVTAAPITRNFQLAAVAMGNLYVLVQNAATPNPPLSGATVAALPTFVGGTTLTGTTDANGYVVFRNITVGTYNVTASDANYTPRTIRETVPATVNDTLIIALTFSATGTKILKGTVTDTSTHATLNHVEVVLTIAGAGVGGGALTLFDSTDANGNYRIVGIPTTSAMGTVVASLTTYDTHTSLRVALGTAGSADSTTFNIAMTKTPTAVNPVARLSTSAGNPEISVSHGMLRLRNFNDAGTVKVFSMNGRLLFSNRFSANTLVITLPRYIAHSGSFYIVSITRKNAVYRKQIMMQ
jgi:large repetitive protein